MGGSVESVVDLIDPWKVEVARVLSVTSLAQY
jgi:hypothetical protein